MFELKITNLTQALLLSQHWATHTVSIVDPDYTMEIPKPGKDSLLRRYSFHDISSHYYSEYFDVAELTMATPEHIQDILEFTEPLQDGDRLLIHCHAGISRSTAVACGVLCQHGLSPIMAIRYVLDIRPQAFPNIHVISLFDEKLGLTGQLVKAVPAEMNRFYGGLLEEEEEL